MLRIRLRRTGKKKQPSYRIVVADSRAPRDGDFVETLGTYNPRSDPSVIVLDEERAKHWLGRGAQPSERVWKILAIQGLAEIPPKLQTRMALGRQRAEDAKAAKPKEEAAPAPEAPAAAGVEAPVAAANEAHVAVEAEAAPAEAETPVADAPVTSAEGDAEPASDEPAEE